MNVRLNVKLAEYLEGVDLSRYSEGDVIALPEPDADLLIRGGWAERINHERRIGSAPMRGAIAAERAS